jgi:hypothetical protein
VPVRAASFLARAHHTPAKPHARDREIRLALSRISSHGVHMATPGRRPTTTREQREQVLHLFAAGHGRRQVARAVFGDERLRGRVDRILRAADALDPHEALERALERLTVDENGSEGEGSPVPTLEELVPLYARLLKRRLEDPSERVSAAELHTFARLELWVENKRRLQRLNELAGSATT